MKIILISTCGLDIFKFYLNKLSNINNTISIFGNSIINVHGDNVNNIIYGFFFLIIVVSSIGVLLSKNPIHSVFFLIIVFLNMGFILLLLNVQFLAFLIFIVYLGAIAVLFLFVIMMFNVYILETRDNIVRYLPLIIGIFLVIAEIVYLPKYIELKFNIVSFRENLYIYKGILKLFNNKDNIKVIGIIYSHYAYLFILASLILFIAMIGVIILTLNKPLDLKKQVYYIQNYKKLENGLEINKDTVKTVFIEHDRKVK